MEGGFLLEDKESRPMVSRRYRIGFPLATVFLITVSVHAAGSEISSPMLPHRIISLAPNTTEILFALGIGERVVGVSRFCDFPPAVNDIPRVGGFTDPNYETIVSLKPDVVILLTSQVDVLREMEKLKIRTVSVPHETIADTHRAIHIIGEICGVTDSAAILSASLTCRAAEVTNALSGRPEPRVLICIGRDMESGDLSGIYVAGHGSFHSEILEAAGGENVCDEDMIAYPQLSAEGVIVLDPEIIVDLVGGTLPRDTTSNEIVRQWDQLHVIRAVKENRVFTLAGDHALRPGPRYVEFLEELAALLHPDVFPKDPVVD
jgi:iron complex transport system substrate-binding protein